MVPYPHTISRANQYNQNDCTPVFLYHCIPIYIKQGFFHTLDKTISEFIWEKKKPRLRMIFLQRPKSVGGMGLPNFKFYYWASNIIMMPHWLQKRPLLWLSIENACCHPSSLPAMLLSALPTVDPNSLSNPVVSHSLKIWSQTRKFYGWQSCSLESPLLKNHAFVPSFNNTMFMDWFEKGIHTFQDIFMD